MVPPSGAGDVHDTGYLMIKELLCELSVGNKITHGARPASCESNRLGLNLTPKLELRFSMQQNLLT